MPKTTKKSDSAKEPEAKTYLLLGGEHNEVEHDEEGNYVATHTYTAGEIFESKRDLITLFGANKFKIVDDDKTVLEAPKPGEGKKVSKEEKDQAAYDEINKVTTEEARNFSPTDPSKKFPYRENAGYEQTPPQEELDNPVDKRKGEKTLPEKDATSSPSASSKKADSKK